jgi:hypothetical protein
VWGPLRLAPDGGSAVTWQEGRQTVWDIRSRAARHVRATGEPHAIRFSPDGRWLAWTEADGLLRIASAGGDR